MIAVSFGLLCIYWIARLIACKSSIIQILLAALSLALFLILPKQFELVSFLMVTVLLIFSLIKHIKTKKPSFRLTTLAGWTFLYMTGGVIALLTIAFRCQDDQVIGHVILKGHEQSTWMSWKNPSQTSAEGAWMPSYEVEVQDAKGNKLFNDYVVGDYVGIRAQMILIHSPYQLLGQLLGFSHLHRLQLVHNGYSTAKRHQLLPHVAYPLPFSMKLFEKVWNQLFLGNWHIPGVKSTTLESSYFPLREAKLTASTQKYDLVIGTTGLSMRQSSPEQPVL